MLVAFNPCGLLSFVSHCPRTVSHQTLCHLQHVRGKNGVLYFGDYGGILISQIKPSREVKIGWKNWEFKKSEVEQY